MAAQQEGPNGGDEYMIATGILLLPNVQYIDVNLQLKSHINPKYLDSFATFFQRTNQPLLDEAGQRFFSQDRLRCWAGGRSSSPGVLETLRVHLSTDSAATWRGVTLLGPPVKQNWLTNQIV